MVSPLLSHNVGPLAPGVNPPAARLAALGYPGAVTKQRDARTVYTTGSGRVCPHCGWPAGDCRCSSQLEEAVPDRIVARLRIERAGRRGKTVTVVEGLPRNAAFLRALAADLKRACGTGGTTVDDRVELQGDHVAALRALLSSRGWLVKG
jgi:translation initiation factor 1